MTSAYRQICIPACLMGALMLLQTGCSPVFYAPNAQNVTQFSKKNESTANVSYGYTEYAKGVNVQGAYSFTDHFAGMANFMVLYGEEKFNNVDTLVFKAHKFMGEMGLGYYTTMKEQLNVESYFGYGFGSVNNTGPYLTLHGNYNINNDFHRLFNQTAVGIKLKYFEIAASVRTACVLMDAIEDTIMTGPFYNLPGNPTNIFNENRNFWVVEPALTVRGGWENLKLQVQYCRSVNLSAEDFPQESYQISIGLFVRMPMSLSHIKEGKPDKKIKGKDPIKM